jgi:putative transcriptional regulator
MAFENWKMISYIRFMVEIEKGQLLIAEPFMKDENFQRAVVLLCQQDDDGSLGILLNKKIEHHISFFLEDFSGINFPIFDGGPVGKDHVHFLHQHPELIAGGEFIIDNIYWGGDYEAAVNNIKNGSINENGIRFYLGYSGWGKNQLRKEMKHKSWMFTEASNNLVFQTDPELIWKHAVKKLGDDFYQ